MTEEKKHPMDNPAMGELVEKLTATMLDTLEGGQLGNWHDAVFAAGVAINAVTSIAYTRCGGDSETYKQHAAKVVASALRQVVEPVKATGQGKPVSLKRVLETDKH